MKAWELAVSTPWTMRPEMVATLLEVAAREGTSPEAVAARLGRPLENTRSLTLFTHPRQPRLDARGTLSIHC
jgi:hypothetical protein